MCQANIVTIVFIAIVLSGCSNKNEILLESSDHDLVFSNLASSWDEGMPIGNGLIGGLVWKKEENLRISLDRSDLWDLRPSPTFEDPQLTYQWLYRHRINGTYDTVNALMNQQRPERYVPTKLPGGALEFDISSLGETKEVRLFLKNALCKVSWENGAEAQIFTHAEKPVGWFRFKTGNTKAHPILKVPGYAEDRKINPERGAGIGYDILYLGYDQGEVVNGENSSVFHQECWGGFSYDIAVKWKISEDIIEGAWSVTSNSSETNARTEVNEALARGFEIDYEAHRSWWAGFWSESSISLPDEILEKQWYNEIYKIGAASRPDTPPISLQAVWTADNDRLPPWNGDYHHDLNTQMSYWPFYSSNKLQYEQGFVDWLWSIMPENKAFTKRVFGVDGLNVPGVSTLEGKPMGGWLQYSVSPTTACWLSHSFYLHWKYSNDTEFLKNRAYPYLKYVAQCFQNLSFMDVNGKRKLPISSSPEIFNNSPEAWFTDITNFDLANIRFVLTALIEMTETLHLSTESEQYTRMLSEWPNFDVDEENCLTFAPGTPYDRSHRHFSHLMAIHPYGLIDWNSGEKARKIMEATINRLDEQGPDYWTGYSYSWLGNLKARAKDGQGAAQALRDFAECFCLRSTFHVNGDQTRSGKSKYTYRPFTLEGNFAFASGVNEMLIQSHTGIVELFPAIPESWKEVSFHQLRTVGAFLVSAEMIDGEVSKVEIVPETGGTLKILNPFFGNYEITGAEQVDDAIGILIIDTTKGQKIVLKASS